MLLFLFPVWALLYRDCRSLISTEIQVLTLISLKNRDERICLSSIPQASNESCLRFSEPEPSCESQCSDSPRCSDREHRCAIWYGGGKCWVMGQCSGSEHRIRHWYSGSEHIIRHWWIGKASGGMWEKRWWEGRAGSSTVKKLSCGRENMKVGVSAVDKSF